MTLMVSQLIGFGGITQSVDFATLVDPTLDANVASENTLNWRCLIAAAAYGLSVNGTQIRITLAGVSSGEDTQYSALWVGHKAVSGNAWDFDGNQVQLKQATSTTIVVPNTGTLVLDIASLAFDHTKDLIVAGYFNSGAADGARQKSSLANYTLYYDNYGVGSSTASSSVPSGSWGAYGVKSIYSIDKIEIA